MQRWMNLAAVWVFGIGLVSPVVSRPVADSKFLTVGDISKIDLKNKSITIDDAASYNIAQLANSGSDSGPARGRAGGGGGGGGGRAGGGGRGAGGGGGRRGGGGSGGSASSSGREPTTAIPMEYKVVVSSKTVIKDGDTQLKIEDLKVGERLQVFSAKGGTKLDALEIVLTPKANP